MQGFLNPEEILKQLRLSENAKVADFGCGSGFWTIPLAKILKEEKIYAFDIREQALSALRGRAKLEKINSIETKLCDLEKPQSTGLNDNLLDFVLIPNLLFQNENKKNIMEEAKRVVKKGGEILVLDWSKSSSLGPKENLAPKEEIKRIAMELNLKLEKEFQAGSFHYGLIFKKIW